MQRVPKKTNEVKFDLLNSTASQDDQVGRGSLHKCLLFGKLIEFTPSAVEPRRFRYGDKYDGNVVARLMPEGK